MSPTYRDRCEAANPELADGEAWHSPRPLSGRTWTDDKGVTWRRRGEDLLTPKQARKLLGRPGVHVMHVYLGEVHEHPDSDGATLAADLEAYWAGDAHPMASFDVGEFRNESHEVMVVIDEGC